MKDRKLQVFVSSTFTDLKEERQAAVEAILSSGHIPAGMELFSAGDESQMKVIERWIDESDVYMLILGGRYGSVDSETGKSYTQLEYEYATSKNKPLFAVVISDKALDEKVHTQGKDVLEQEYSKELKVFKAIVLTKLVKFWDDKKDIKLTIHETLSEFSYSKDLVGWIRGDNVINSGLVAEEIARLTSENSELKSKLNIETNTALYSGLSYNEMEGILKGTTFQENGTEITLYNYLINIDNILNVMILSPLDDPYKTLILYKLIKVVGGNSHIVRCRFTEEGHNFYLKALVNQQKNKAP